MTLYDVLRTLIDAAHVSGEDRDALTAAVNALDPSHVSTAAADPSASPAPAA